MAVRTLLVALLLSTPVLLLVPAASAQEPVAAVCGSAASPVAIADAPIVGHDASAASPAALVPTDDCFFSFALPGGPEANVGKQLVVSLTSSENHDVFVRRDSAAIAAPYVCSSVASTATSDACTAGWPLTQPTYSIRVARAAAGSGNFTLSVAIANAPASGCSNSQSGYGIDVLTPGVAKAATIATAVNSRCYFKVELTDPAADLAKFSEAFAAPSTALAATIYLLAKQGDVPAGSDTGCTVLSGSPRVCNLDIPVVGGAPWYVLVGRTTLAGSSAQSVTVTASSASSCSLGRGIHPIAAGETLSSATVGPDAGSKCDFLLVPSQVESLDRFTLTPGAANTDLYVFKPGSASPAPIPRTGFVCSSASTSLTTNDVCAASKEGQPALLATVHRPAGGAAASGFSLKAEAIEGCSVSGAPTSGVTALLDQAAVPVVLSNDFDAFCRFSFQPNPLEATVRVSDVITSPAPPSSTTVQTIAETLYVKRGAPASPSSFDCSAVASVSVGTTASGGAVTSLNGLCDLQNLGDDIHVLVRRSSGSPASIVTARAFSPCAFDDGSAGGSTHPLLDGVAVTGSLLNDDGGTCLLRFDVPASGDAASFALAPDAAADFDLLVKLGSAPTPSSFDCKSSSNVTGAAESCLSVLGPGSYFAAVRRVAGSGPWSLLASSVSSCGLGTAPSPLEAGVALEGSLLDAAGAKCFFGITPGDPLADPASPADDVLRLELSQDAASNFDLYVRKAAIPSTTSRDCQSIQAAGAADVCELAVSDGSPYYALVRRVSGSGPFSIQASTSHSCALGPGYHELVNGQELQSSTRAVAGATKCYFTIASVARDDLLSIVQEAKTANTGFSLAVARDHPIGAGPNECTGTSSYISIPSLGLNLNTLAQCDILLEDGLPHLWHVSVGRTASAGANPIQFAVKATAQQIPTLVAGVPQVGHVDTGGIQYWKVVLPANATFLDIQTAGDVSNLACSLGSSANSLVATACLLLPFPKLVGCALAAGYGVSCDQAELTLAERCAAELGEQLGDNGTAVCQQIEDARVAACAAANNATPGSCIPSDSEGSVSGTCGVINRRTGDATCDPLGASVKTTELDLLVRHRAGLPKSSAHDCRSAGPGAVERCLFSDDVKEVHDNVTEPARADLNEQLGNLTAIVAGNRTVLDEALAELKLALAENRSAVIEPLWASVRALVFSLTGQDPGALPATPSVPSVATPGAAVPDPLDAKPLPGPGKYFIAVRGPLDLASSLYYQGGDYAIVALHDDLQAPSRQDLADQADATLGLLDRGLRDQCAAQTRQDGVCANLDAVGDALCALVNATGQPCAPSSGSPSEVLAAVCVLLQADDCPGVPSVNGACAEQPELCAGLDDALGQAGGLLGLLPVVTLGPPGLLGLPSSVDVDHDALGLHLHLGVS